MLPWSAELAGRLHEHVIGSELLRGNSLGDPHERPLYVYTPPGYDEPGRAYPVVYVIQRRTCHCSGCSASLRAWHFWSALPPGLARRARIRH